jgi:hypothetical protein
MNGHGDPLHLSPHTSVPRKLARTSPTSDGYLVGILRLRTQGHGVFCHYLNAVQFLNQALSKLVQVVDCAVCIL